MVLNMNTDVINTVKLLLGGEGMATPPHLPSSPRRDHNSSQRITSPFRRDPASSQKVASASSGRQQQQQQLQYLVNEDTGRAIKIHGPTYHKLLAQGYQVRLCWLKLSSCCSSSLCHLLSRQVATLLLKVGVGHTHKVEAVKVHGPTFHKLPAQGYQVRLY